MGVVAGDVVLMVGFSSVVRKVVSIGTGVSSCVVRVGVPVGMGGVGGVPIGMGRVGGVPVGMG